MKNWSIWDLLAQALQDINDDMNADNARRVRRAYAEAAAFQKQRKESHV